MPKLSPLKALLTAQFLSAFVDNMILFIVLAVIKRDGYPAYYLPLVQTTFLASYILLSPWVGRFADRNPKAEVLVAGNLVKAAGALLILFHGNPALSYAVVGIGAVIYSPAKYGILPYLTSNEKELLSANSALEGCTILAILTGSVAGGILSDISIPLALATCLLLYAASVSVNTLIPSNPGNRSIRYQAAISEFSSDCVMLLRNRQSHFSLIGSGSFWLASAVLRMIVFAWVPLTLGITSGSSISLIIAVTGVGIALGAAIAPRLITIQQVHRAVWFGYAMALCIFTFLCIKSLMLVVTFLLLIGVLGGIYIVPMNAALQRVGQQSIGEGKTIAVQNFVENSFMCVGVGLYTLATQNSVTVSASIGVTGTAMLLLVTYLFFYAKVTK